MFLEKSLQQPKCVCSNRLVWVFSFFINHSSRPHTPSQGTDALLSLRERASWPTQDLVTSTWRGVRHRRGTRFLQCSESSFFTFSIIGETQEVILYPQQMLCPSQKHSSVFVYCFFMVVLWSHVEKVLQCKQEKGLLMFISLRFQRSRNTRRYINNYFFVFKHPIIVLLSIPPLPLFIFALYI